MGVSRGCKFWAGIHLFPNSESPNAVLMLHPGVLAAPTERSNAQSQSWVDLSLLDDNLSGHVTWMQRPTHSALLLSLFGGWPPTQVQPASAHHQCG
eukprot:354570-Amphidinium_carterae.1